MHQKYKNMPKKYNKCIEKKKMRNDNNVDVLNECVYYINQIKKPLIIIEKY